MPPTLTRTSDVPTANGQKVVKAKHPEYQKYARVWQWLQDSLEGGENYRDADYGSDSYPVRYVIEDASGQNRTGVRHVDLPRHNLIRHPHEYPQPYGDVTMLGLMEGAPSTNDEYEFRRALTPVPNYVNEYVEAHLARIYAREVRRDAPPGPEGDALRAWWADVDGKGTSIDDWMQEAVAPLFAALGQIDLAFDHPSAPSYEPVQSRADAERLNLTACVATIVLPENLPDWQLCQRGGYDRAVVREVSDAGGVRFREWTEESWILYDCDGREIASDDHGFSVVPIFRCFERKKQRYGNIGQSGYESIAEDQRAAYNTLSELILSNSLQSSPVLSGPEDFCTGNEIAVGPGNLLPKKMSHQNGTYEGWEYVTPKNDPADKLERRLEAFRDSADRAACMTKPAGAKGSSRSTVSQSGVSKMLDQAAGNDLLGRRSRALQRLEIKAATMAATVQNDGPPDPAFLAGIHIVYPTRFDLFTPGDFAALIADFQSLCASVDGELPETTSQMLRTYVRLTMPGLTDDIYAKLDDEITSFLDRRTLYASQQAEGPPVRNAATVSMTPQSRSESVEDAPTDLSGA